jgi:hypothetical protein
MGKKIKTLQKFKLEEVRDGVATIRMSTVILTPVREPAIEAQLVQRESSGVVRFDIDAGRIIGQQMDVDKQVVGFRGEASSLHYLSRFTEQIVATQLGVNAGVARPFIVGGARFARPTLRGVTDLPASGGPSCRAWW